MLSGLDINIDPKDVIVKPIFPRGDGITHSATTELSLEYDAIVHCLGSPQATKMYFLIDDRKQKYDNESRERQMERSQMNFCCFN